MSTAPSAPAGEVASTSVSLTTLKSVAAMLPKFTAEVLVSPVPVIVTIVPPVLGPDVGLTAVIVGVGGGGPAVMLTFCTWCTSLNPPVEPVNPSSTYGGRLVW